MKKIAFPTMLCLMLAVFINSCEPFIEPPKHFSVVFHANGGKGSMKMQIMNMGNEESLKLSPNTFTRDGYVFTGWNTEATGKGRVFKDRQIISSHENLSLYAQWKSAGGSGGGGSTSGTESGHKWVDLGLPSGLKWATCNVGASTPEGYGSYFAWGETSPKDNYEWSTYKYNGSSILTKYNTKSSLGTVDNKTTLELSDDAARANWGGNWRMPTQAEQDELIKNCTWTWVILDGVSGYKVVSKTNANSIFLPAAGYKVGSYVSGFGSYGYYWSSSLYESNPIYACFLSSYSSGVNWNGYYRYEGRSVRAVYGDNTAAQTFTLTFNANGGSGTMAAQTFEAGVSQALAANAFTRSGYTFTGWNTKADGSGNSYTDGQEIALLQDITLYAQWKKVTYGNVEYAQVDVNAAGIVDGGTALSAGTVLAQSANVTMTVGASDTYRTATAAANDMTKVRIGSSVLDLAVACQGATYPKDATGGNCDANATVPASGAFLAFDVKKDGYLYVVIKASSHKTYLVGEEYTLIGYDFAMHTPNAPWGSILRYTLEGEGEYNLIVQGSKAAANLIWPEKIALGEAWEAAAGEAGRIGVAGTAVIKFPVFAGFRYTVNGCGTKIIASGYFFGTSEEKVVLDDGYGNEVVLYETGVSNTNYYNVTFNANGGTGTMAAQTFEAGISQAIAANAFTRSGYTFTGWNTKADGSGTSYTDKQSITLSQNITLYAQWKKDIVNYTVTFNANGGTGTMAAQTFVAGVSQTIAANTFTRSGYTFTGWNTKADGSGTSYTDKQSLTISQNITLYAQWKKDIVNYTVTFNANGGSGTMAAQTFEAGVSQAIAANAFTRSGYTFTGWNTKADGSGTSYTDKQSITLSQNITLYAQWKKVTYGNVEYAQVNVANTGILEGGTALTAGTVLAQSANVTMTVGVEDTYKLTSAVVNDMTRAIVGGASIDLSIACQGSINPKDVTGGNCDANATVPASGAFFTFDVKKDGYLYVVIKASSNKTYLVGEEGVLIGYDFAMHTPEQAWGTILKYTLVGEGEFNYVTDPSLLIWPERIALGEGWEAAAGEAGKIAASGVAVIKFPVFGGLRYTVNGCGTKIIASGYFFGTSEETVVLDDGYGNEVVLF